MFEISENHFEYHLHVAAGDSRNVPSINLALLTFCSHFVSEKGLERERLMDPLV